MHHASQPSSPASQASHPLEAPSWSLTSAPAGPGPDTPSSPALLSGWHLAQERRRREKHLEALEQERRQVARLLDDAFLVLGMAVRPSSGTNGSAAATGFHQQLDAARAQHSALLAQHAALRQREAAVQQEMARLSAAQDAESAPSRCGRSCIEACNQKCGQEMTRCFGLYGQEAPICEPLVTATRQCLPMCPGICGTE